MSTTRRSKKDIDRFISQFPDDQISARGYQVAVLYSEIGEYDLAKKYLTCYMTVRDNLPQAHKLMAQICEGLQEKEQAIACYKRCLELDNSQKGTILKICEVLSSMPPDDAQRIKYWSEKAEKVFPNNPVVFKLKEKILSSSSGTDLDKLEELYSKQLEKNYTDASLHIKLMDLYLTSDRVQAAVNHGIEVERTLAFVQNPAWYKCLIKAFSTHHQREQGSDDIYIHHLFALQNLVSLMMPDHDVVTCATALHQFDQCLFELAKASSQRPKWRAVVTEMEGQIYFLSALVLFKRAQKGQVLWKDASFFATVCLLLSSQYPAIDVKAAWYLQLKQHNRKFFDRIHKIGAYRHSQGGYLVLGMTRSDVSRLQHIKQQLKTPRAREVFYDTLFTLREMRDRKDKSYILNSDSFHKVPVVVPSKAVVAQYDKDVLLLYGDNLHVLVWQALQSYNTRDTTQPYYGMDLYSKLPYTSTALTNGSPESLSQVDVQAFFCAAVRCAAVAYEDQNKSFRPDSYRPHFLPACLSQSLCSKVQSDWWQAMFKFSVGTPRDNFAKLRLAIQQGLETIRLVGAHGIGLTLVTHLAQTFDKWTQTLKQDGSSDPTKSEALEGRAVFYWKEAMQMLKRLEKNLPYRYPKERLFVDGNQINLDAGQIADLKEQATFSLAVLDMREGQYEEAKEKFETSKKPMATYYLAQIYRILANKVSSDDPGGSDQKKALLERSLDMLYQALDRIQGDPEHELHKEIPNTLDEVVSLLERMQMPTGTSLIDSISVNNNADNSLNDDTPSFSTPTSFHTTPGVEQNGTPISRNANVSGSWAGGSIAPLSLFPKDSPSFVASNIIEQSTPAPVQRRESSQHVRPSPERLDARIWALEKKMATLIELQEQSKKHWERTVQDSIRTMQEEMRAEMAQNNDILKEMKEFLASFRGSAAGRFVGPAPFRPPQYYPPQQQSWMPPGNYGYHMSPVPGAPLAPYPGNMGPFPPANRLTPQPPVGPTMNQMSHQNDIVEDDIYHIDGEYYEDDGSQPPPHNMYNEAQLGQEWPFGHRAGLEGKSTITYTPPGQQGQTMPQPGMFANALRGPSLQYTIKQPSMGPMQGPRLPTSQQPTQPLPGPGFFSFPQSSAAMFNPQDPTYQMTSRSGIVIPPASQPSALMAVLTRSPTSDVTTTTVSMPPNVLATSCMQAQSNMAQTNKDSLFEGKPVSICQPQSMVSLGQTSTPSSVPLFTSLMAASKSPDTSDIHQSPLRSAEVPSGTSSGPRMDSLNLTPFTDFASLTKSSSQSGMFRPTSTGVQKSPMTSPVKSSGRHDDDVVEEYEPKVDFKPIIDLPDLVEIKTGEEEEEKLFGERAKLFRYDPDINQWKERGIGEIKLLRHRSTGQVRVLMRREQVLKLCANHKLTTAMKLVPMANSDRAWCWTAMDYAEGELKTERLAVRFKSPDQANLFKETFEECQKKIQKQEQKPPSSSITAEKKEKHIKGPTSLAEMFKPPADSWECEACYVSNKADIQKCVACNTPRPGAKPAAVAQTKNKEASNLAATGQTLRELFRPEEGSWECNGCYVSNKPDVQKCVACQALKPGLKSSDVKSSPASSGFKFGVSSGGGFKFGKAPAESETKTTPSVSKPAAGGKPGQQSLSEMFRPASGNWECEGCYVSNKADVQKCVACSTLKPGLKPEDVKPAAPFSVGQTGFKFGAPATSGFKFGIPSTASDKETKSTPVTASTEPTSAGFMFGQTEAFSFKKTETASLPSNTSTTAGGAGGFKFNMATPVSISSEQISTTTASSTTLLSTQSKTTPGIGSGIAPAQPSAKSTTFGATQEGFNFNLGKTSTDLPQQASSDSTAAPATFSFPTESGPMSSGFSFKTTTEPKTPESKQSTMSSGFQFTFTPGAQGKSPGVASPKSPETDYYQNKEGEDDHIYFEPIVALPEAVSIVTGEEEDEVLFEHRAKLYRFDKKEWKERGLGNVKILYNRDTEKSRLLMRREQILKVCCHHYITPDLMLKPMPKTDGKAFIWFAMDFSDETPNMEQFSIRFKSSEVARKFADAFDIAREKSGNQVAEPESSQAPSVARSSEVKSPSVPDKTQDVVFVGEEKATKEQIAEARKYMLPDHFYLYLSREPCRGCRGCTDSMPGDPAIKPKDNITTSKSSGDTSGKSEAVTSSVFGSGEGAGSGLFGGLSADKVFGAISTSGTPSFGPLFGASSTSGTPSFGPVFGASSTSGTPSSGPIFGASSTSGTPSSGPIFGASSTSGTPSSGPVFGASSTSGTPSSDPVLGAKPSSQSTDGIFSTPATGKLLGSLPSTKASSTGGLFGSIPATTIPPTGGLFGSTPTTAASSSKGLFGSVPHTSSFGTQSTASASETSSTPKDSGDHSVSPGGTVFGGQTTDSAAEFSFSLLAAQSGSENAFKKDANKPFSWSGAGKQLFGVKSQDGGTHDGDGEDEVVEGHDPHFEPIVALPDLVEIKTGEEDFDALFSIRAQLFRFDKDVSQWKEKGRGEMKILQQHATGKIRLLLRREQIFKLACNHWLTPDLAFKPLNTSEVAWCWTSQDFSENEPRVEQLAVKFKTIEIANKFKLIIDNCQAEMRENLTQDKTPIQVSEVSSVESREADTTQSTKEQEEEENENEEEDDDDDDEDDDDDDDDDDDEEMILFEKRATMYAKENDKWKILGMGQLKVLYDEDVNGNRITMETDEKITVCNHLLIKESILKVNKKSKNCDWSPIDFSTDDPVRREFRAQFSSETVLEEFERFFKQGQTLAVDSDLSERDIMMTSPREIVYPEVHAHNAGTED
ncbi:E3 SUMO-protein ligase RanBP2-like isoform X2 [Mizuhopecten yessoensis]|uniref:E3 SUMO-protein ligase RanBP2-like isoform X2 n=1 Tax=Mizuhopecten yessoensis TaxID=6573 RepID=UPI000B45DBE2|nr:E3 SUMO-protein ligase RanBP2-like isoform X2 [Mizuhopecten yessoensis]